MFKSGQDGDKKGGVRERGSREVKQCVPVFGGYNRFMYALDKTQQIKTFLQSANRSGYV